jgi:hypothetical protein
VIASKSELRQQRVGTHEAKSRLKVEIAIGSAALTLDQNCHAFAAFVILYQTG